MLGKTSVAPAAPTPSSYVCSYVIGFPCLESQRERTRQPARFARLCACTNRRPLHRHRIAAVRTSRGQPEVSRFGVSRFQLAPTVSARASLRQVEGLVISPLLLSRPLPLMCAPQGPSTKRSEYVPRDLVA